VKNASKECLRANPKAFFSLMRRNNHKGQVYGREGKDMYCKRLRFACAFELVNSIF